MSTMQNATKIGGVSCNDPHQYYDDMYWWKKK